MKRARFDGPSDAGEVGITLDSGEIVQVTVERGSLLPAEVERDNGDKVNVPAKVRDALLEQDGWSEVAQSSGAKKDDTTKEDER